MLKIALTGGIGSGKSHLARAFAHCGASTLSADEAARELNGARALPALTARFGTQILQSNGTLDRAQLRRLIFSDAQAKRDLEAIMHPLIWSALEQQMRAVTTSYVIVEIALLAEHPSWRALVDRVLLVDCPREQQIERVMRRDAVSRTQAIAICDQQASREQRLQIADDVVFNTQEQAHLSEAARQLDVFYRNGVLSSNVATRPSA